MTPYTASLFAAEPRLAALRTTAASVGPGDWIAWHLVVKQPLVRLIGWYAVDAPPALRTPVAYEAVYQELLDAWELQHEGEARDAA